MEEQLGILEEAGREEVRVPGGGELWGLLHGGQLHPPRQDGGGVWGAGEEGREVVVGRPVQGAGHRVGQHGGQGRGQ